VSDGESITVVSLSSCIGDSFSDPNVEPNVEDAVEFREVLVLVRSEAQSMGLVVDLDNTRGSFL
jgi:hypothetical protein